MKLVKFVFTLSVPRLPGEEVSMLVAAPVADAFAFNPRSTQLESIAAFALADALAAVGDPNANANAYVESESAAELLQHLAKFDDIEERLHDEDFDLVEGIEKLIDEENLVVRCCWFGGAGTGDGNYDIVGVLSHYTLRAITE